MLSLAHFLTTLTKYDSTGAEPKLSTVVMDSREVEKGSLFVAVAGEHVDGHDYVTSAFANGAVAALVERPFPTPSTFLLILDAIQTPGNLGTMLRTAAAAGVDGVVLAPGCVDPYNPKVVRGSMGTLLRLPVHQLNWDEIATLTHEMDVWVAIIDGETAYTAVSWTNPTALIIGSEAHGANPQARQIAGGGVTIPMHKQTESLNAAMAAGIILFEAKRQRDQKLRD